MNHSFLLTGGNLGSRVENLEKAKQLLSEKVGQIIAASSLYETAAWGNNNQPDFLNQVLLFNTSLSAHELLDTILDIERLMGRTRANKYDARLIDIDILFFNDEVIDDTHLKVPHPLLQHRRFVLEPLFEIAPDFLHPVLHQSMSRLLEQCNDPLRVKKF